MNAAPGSTINSCNHTNECTSNYDKHCCVNAFMADPVAGTEHSIYRCMNEKIADANLKFSIEGLEVSMKCVGKSSAAKLSMVATATLASLAAMTLY